MTRLLRLLLLGSLLALAGCGSTTVVKEPPVVVKGGGGPMPAGEPISSGAVRIAVVTHGQASSPFWAVVRPFAHFIYSEGFAAAVRRAERRA